jgi:hypothetical protein
MKSLTSVEERNFVEAIIRSNLYDGNIRHKNISCDAYLCLPEQKS